MKILLVRPPRIKQAIALGEFMFSEPIGLEMIYSILEKKYEVEIFDMMADNTPLLDKLSSYNPNVIAITSLCIDVDSVLEIAKSTKTYNQKIITIVGGTQAYLNPDAFKAPYIDHIMKFTNENNLQDLYTCIDTSSDLVIEGVLSKHFNYSNDKLHGYNQYIIPNRNSTSKYRHKYSYFGYKPAALIATSMGCSSKCSFCLRWRIEGFNEFYFPIEDIQRDIENIKEDTIMIYDNDFLHNPARINLLCDILEKNNINKNFICYGSVNSILSNKKEIKRFKSNGLKAILVGYETFNELELSAYNKNSNPQTNIEASLFLRKENIDVWASFIVHPDWSKEDFKKLRRYIKILSPQISSFSPLTPFPNLPLYNEFKSRLIIDKSEYSSWNFGQVCIYPSQMNLKEYYIEILKTNFYINLFTNNIMYMHKKFGFFRMVHLAKGSLVLLNKYIKLIKNA